MGLVLTVQGVGAIEAEGLIHPRGRIGAVTTSATAVMKAAPYAGSTLLCILQRPLGSFQAASARLHL